MPEARRDWGKERRGDEGKKGWERDKAKPDSEVKGKEREKGKRCKGDRNTCPAA